MDNETRAIVAAGEEVVDRAKQELKSRQPRYSVDRDDVFISVVRWLEMAEIKDPGYSPDSRARDSWLRNFWRRESHLAGVLSSVIAIDKNRGWNLIGGRNQVKRYQDILLHDAEEGQGWRTYAALQSESFYTADINAITEVGTDGEGGPLRRIWHVDPARCALTGDMEEPLEYFPANSGSQRWKPSYFWRVASMPYTDETYNGLGYCAVSRALEFAKIMYAVFQHDQEMLGARAPKGLLLLSGIEEEQWLDALSVRESMLDGLARRYFGSVMTLASSGENEIDAKLVALSQLPQNFNKKEFTALVMYGYALCFGYDPSEFWPVEFGALGRGTETAVQHRKGTAKGGLDYVLGHQERIQERLPDTLAFEYEQRDAEGEKLDAELANVKADLVIKLYQAKNGELPLLGQTPEIAQQRAMELLAEHGIVPREWADTDEEAEASDLSQTRMRALRERALLIPEVQEAVCKFPDEPIVRFNSLNQHYTVLWERGDDALRRHSWNGFSAEQASNAQPAQPALHTLPALPALAGNTGKTSSKIRQAAAHAIISEFSSVVNESLAGYIAREYTRKRAQTQMLNAINTAWPDIAAAAWEDGGRDTNALTRAERAMIAGATREQSDYAVSFWSEMPDIRSADDDPFPRGALYVQSLRAFYNEWRMRAIRNRVLVWELGSTREHCATCRANDGQRHRAIYWLERNMIPGKPGASLECEGYHCRCNVRDVRTREIVNIRVEED